MLVNWPKALGFVWQGDNDGAVNDQAQGEKFATSRGITQTTWDDAVDSGVVTGELSSATSAQCATILKTNYWDFLACDQVSSGCDLVIFNNGMVCGSGHAARLVQRIVGTVADGKIGPRTLLAIRGYGQQHFIDEMTTADEEYYAALANAPLYLRGWDRREVDAKKLAYQLAGLSNSV